MGIRLEDRELRKLQIIVKPKIDSLFTFMLSSPSSAIANKIQACKICACTFELT